MQDKALALLAPMLCLTGCAASGTGSNETSVEVREALPSVPSNWEALANASPVTVGWIASFDDATLTALVDEAQANNRNLAIAATNVDRAKALARQARGALVPNVVLAAGAESQGTMAGAGPASSLTSALQVSWEADLWGRIQSGVDTASATAQAVEADYGFAQHALAANTAIAYFTAIEAKRQTAIARDSLAVLERMSDLVGGQYEGGYASAQDVALTRSDVSSTRERVANLDGAQRNALRALELLLGRYPGADLQVKEVLPVPPPAPPAGVPTELLERRPDLIAAERRVAAAFSALDQAKAARLPTLSLTSSLGGASDGLSTLLRPENVAWRAGANLLAPIFDGGRRRENVAIATAIQQQAVASYADAALRAFAEVERALDQGVVLQERGRALADAASQAAEAYRLAEVLYEEGQSSLIDLLTVQQRVIGTRSALSSVQRLQLEQRTNLYLALGGGYAN